MTRKIDLTFRRELVALLPKIKDLGDGENWKKPQMYRLGLCLMKKELAFELGIYALCIILVGLLWHRPVILTICYVIISIVVLIKWHTKSDLLFYFVTFALGPIGESVAIYLGAWKYSKPLYLIPSWLPFLWGICALFLKNISETILTSGKKP
jgi:hypothetical protein